MVAGHRGAQGGHGVMESEAVAGEGVGVPLANDGEVLVFDGLCGHVEPVQQFPLKNRGCSGELRYLGLSSGSTMRPPNATTRPCASRIGNISLFRNASYAPSPCCRTLASPISRRRLRGMPRPIKWGTRFSQPSGANPKPSVTLGLLVVSTLDKSGSSFCSSGRSEGRHKEVLCGLHDVKHGSAIRSLLPSSGRGGNFNPNDVRTLGPLRRTTSCGIPSST